MNNQRSQKEQPYQPQARAQRLEEVGVGIYLVWVSEDLEVASEVANHKSEKYKTRHRHRNFLADGRFKENVQNFHRVADLYKRNV